MGVDPPGNTIFQLSISVLAPAVRRFGTQSHIESFLSEGDVQADSACSQDAVNLSLLSVDQI